MSDREEFEQWACSMGRDWNLTTDLRGNYISAVTGGAWEAWQAAQAPASGEVKPIGFCKALDKAQTVFGEYCSDYPKWMKRISGTPVVNDLPVRMAKAFSDLYTYPPKPESRVPEGLLHRIKSLLVDVGHHGIPITEEGQCYEIGKTEVAEAQELVGILTTTTEPADRWIMCSERLPKVGQKVRLKRNGEELPYMPSFQFNTGKVFWDFDDYDADPDILPTDKWMPRNNPP